MTPKQQQVLEFYRDTLREKRYSPSYVEIMEHTGHKSTASINRLITNLIDREYLMYEMGKGRNRNIVLTPLGRAANKREVCSNCGFEL